jgi:predicted component of type VI protein secretion system
VATLIGQSGPLAGNRFELEGEVVLGRENAQITLADDETSRRHAAIRVVDGVVTISDLGSTNGTFVNGKRIDTATELRDGETIRVGKSTFRLELPVPAPDVDAMATRIAERPAELDDRTVQRLRPPTPPPPAAKPHRPSPEPARAPASAAAPQPRPEPPLAAAPPAARPPQPRPDPPRAPAAPPPAARQPQPTAAPSPAPAAPAASAAQPFGAFASAQPRRRRSVASRKLAPALVSSATILVTACALVAYFAGR